MGSVKLVFVGLIWVCCSLFFYLSPSLARVERATNIGLCQLQVFSIIWIHVASDLDQVGTKKVWDIRFMCGRSTGSYKVPEPHSQTRLWTCHLVDLDLFLGQQVVELSQEEVLDASMQDIRSLFPEDCNPFYAGFGNRDTDEISYLKVGIPKGKIFIINPRVRN